MTGYMTIRDLVEFFGVSERTIRRKVNELNLSISHGKEARFNKNEVKQISVTLYKKLPMALKIAIDNTFRPISENDHSEHRTNAGVPNMNKNVQGTTSANDTGQFVTNAHVSMNDVLDSIKALADIANISMKSLDNRMSNIEGKYQERKALLPAPQKTDRMNLNEIVRSCADKAGNSYQSIWKLLYKECSYRLSVNLRLQAERNNQSVLDYVTISGLMPEVLAIAMEILS